VQKMSFGDYWFRHHLETIIETPSELSEVTFKRRRSPNSIKTVIKVRLNHLGQIIQVGEY
jgi:CRISPR-associated endonuclease Csn1